MAAKSSITEEASKPTFVFKGTVQALKKATMKEVPVDDRTIIVTIDQVIEAPENLARLAGQQVTVQLSGNEKVKIGQQMIFHTVTWIYGDSIAVRALSQEPAKTSRMAAIGSAGDPVARRDRRQKRERFAAADLVVSGKVMAVRLPSKVAQKTKGVRAAGLKKSPPPKPVSEHDPKWREAVVEVGDVHKGSHQKKEVVVRFPASMDVMWHNAPKFHPGQQGFFMLKKGAAEEPEAKSGKKTAGKRSAKAAGIKSKVEGEEAYVALDPTDFQPFTEPGGVKAIIESAEDDLDK
jgi:hypothetical protein